jgi:predicted TIM-barrel fold metal-dependent hydrolase
MGVLAFPSLVYAHKPGMAAWLNSWATDFAARHDDVLHTMTFFPEPEALDYVTRGLAAGVQVVKVHVQVGDFDPSDPMLDEVWGVLADARVPVVTHCGSGPTPGRFTGPEVFGRVLQRHPSLTAVIAHLGMPEYEAFLDLADRYPRVHLDTTMAFTDFVESLAPFPAELRPRLLALGDRIVLGSDFPNTPYPYAHQVESLVRLDLGDAWLRGVLHDNGTALITK